MRVLTIVCLIFIGKVSNLMASDLREAIGSKKEQIYQSYISVKESADKGDINSHYELFRLVTNNQPKLNDNIEEAFSYMVKAGRFGHIESQYTLGTLYQTGLIVEKNIDIAGLWLLKAAQQGHIKATISLGNNFLLQYRASKEHGANEQLFDSAVKWYSKADDAGSLVGKRLLGNALTLKKISYSRGIELLREAAKSGDIKAMFSLARNFDLHWQLEHEDSHYEKAIFWYKKAFNHGHDKAEFYLLKLENDKKKTD